VKTSGFSSNFPPPLHSMKSSKQMSSASRFMSSLTMLPSSTFRVRIHRPWHRHFGPTVGLNGSYAKGGIQAAEADKGVYNPTDGKNGSTHLRAARPEIAIGLHCQPAGCLSQAQYQSSATRVWCSLFVLIRHGEEGAASLHAGLERLGKETGEPTGTFGSHPLRTLVLTFCINSTRAEGGVRASTLD